ncbi:phospholipase D family protein [Candidatus Binatus sp.]|uniref:phospholipase D family protein n=1 Tax=Candidatus Binatus sp. TaxID=2811406 RepID=UPI003C33F3EB
MQNLYTNRSHFGDFVQNAFTAFGEKCEVQIASAFFSEAQVIRDLVSRQCTVKLVVRLGSGTSPDALVRSVSMPGVQIRYFSDRSFHPKLYIFGGACCLVGSANLTTPGMRSNQEVAILLPSDDPRFDELSRLFVDFWSQAKALDRAEAERFRRAVSSVPKRPDPDVDQVVQAEFGCHAFANIERDPVKESRRGAYLESYRRRYEEFRHAFATVREIYTKLGRRLVPEENLPLRIEIDQLFNFIRNELAAGDSYRTAALLQGPPLEARVKDAIERFWQRDPDYLHEVTRDRCPLIRKVLGTPGSIDAATEDELYDALLIVHAFHDRFRFFDGGEPTMKKVFLTENGLDRIKKTLSYLLHGSESDYVARMADCIFDPNYRLQDFGESCVQETLGWVNNEDVPTCNSRTLKSLRWLGFDLTVA